MIIFHNQRHYIAILSLTYQLSQLITVDVGIQWNPVNTVTNLLKKIGRIGIYYYYFFLQENVWPFCRAAKKSGRNNEVTIFPWWPYGEVSLYLDVE